MEYTIVYAMNGGTLKRRLDSFFHKHFTSEMFTYQEIFKMLIPLILDMFFISAIAMITTSMISSSSQDSVAAVSLINPITTLLVCVINAVAAGGTVVVAQYKGRKDELKILQASGHTLSITIVIAIVLNTIVILCSPVIVNGFFGNAEAAVIDKAILYLVGVSISSITLSIFTSIFSIFRGLGETKVCLYLTVFINFAYLFLSVLFVNQLKWDIQGTVLALNIARLIGTAVAIYYLFYKKNRLLALKKEHVLQFNPSYVKSIFKISIPFSAEQCFYYGGAIIGQIMISDFDTKIIASYAIVTSLLGVITAAPMAVGTLATTIIGQSVGAENRNLARWYGKKLVHLGTVLLIISIGIFLPVSQYLIQLYNPDPTSLSTIWGLLLIGMIPMPFVWAMSNIMPHVLRSAGDATYSSVVSLITMWSIRVGLGYLLAIVLGYGIHGIFFAASAEWVIRFFLFHFRYKGTRWLTKHTID